MKEKGINKLVCSLCGIEVDRKRWSTHWLRAHNVESHRYRKVLKEGEVPTNPKWLGKDNGQPMFENEVNSNSMSELLPEIMYELNKGNDIPWQYRDYTFKLLKEGNLMRR